MKNLRSVGGLLAISAALSCATAIDDTISGQPGAGSNSGGAAGLAEEGGAPAGGAPAAGAPSSAGKGGSASTGGSAGKGSAGSGSGGKSGTGGTVGVSGAAGANSGGKAGTSSGGAAGSAGGSAGSGGGTTTGPCENPKDVAGGNTTNLGIEAVCLRTKDAFNNVVCQNFAAGRTLKVNGVLHTPCTAGTKTFPAAIDGWNYFDVSAGGPEYATLTWYKM